MKLLFTGQIARLRTAGPFGVDLPPVHQERQREGGGPTHPGDTGPLQNLPAPSLPGGLYLPLASNVWSDSGVSYKYDDPQGTFNGSQGAMLYAPEGGTIMPLSDGGFVLTVHDQDNDREWLGGYVEGLNKVFGPNESVRAGQPLGRLSKPAILALKVTKKGTSEFQMVDPVELLQRAGAQFADLAFPAGGPSTAIVPAGGAATPPAGVPSTTEAIEVFKATPKPQFTAIHLAAAMAGGTVLGFLMVRAFRKGR